MKTFLIYGVPGTGKSTLAAQAAERMGATFIELDEIRNHIAENENRFLRIPSTLAWQEFGQLNKETAVEGFLRVRAALEPYVFKKLQDMREDYVAEAAFTSPSLAASKVALVAIKSEQQHYQRFFVHRKPSLEADQQFKAARFIQEFLIEEADRLDVPVFYNDGEIVESIRGMFKLLDTKDVIQRK